MKSVALLVLAVLSVFANATDPAPAPAPADHDDGGTSGHAHTGPAIYLEANIEFDPASEAAHVLAVKTGIAAAIAAHDAGVNVTATHVTTAYSVVPVAESEEVAADAGGHRRLTGTAHDITVNVAVPEGDASANALSTTVADLTAAEINTAVVAAITADDTITAHTHFEVTAVHAHAQERDVSGARVNTVFGAAIMAAVVGAGRM